MLILEMSAARPVIRQTITNGYKLPPRVVALRKSQIKEILRNYYKTTEKLFATHGHNTVRTYANDDQGKLEMAITANWDDDYTFENVHLMRKIACFLANKYTPELGFIAIPVSENIILKSCVPAMNFRDWLNPFTIGERVGECAIILNRRRFFIGHTSHPTYDHLYWFSIWPNEDEEMDPHIIVAHPAVFITEEGEGSKP